MLNDEILNKALQDPESQWANQSNLSFRAQDKESKWMEVVPMYMEIYRFEFLLQISSDF